MRAFALFSLAGLWVQLLLHFHLCPALPFGFDGIPLDMTFLPLWFLTPRAISVIPHPYLVTTPEMPCLATDLIPYPPEQGVVLRAWKFIRGETTFTWSLVSIVMSGTEKYSVNIYWMSTWMTRRRTDPVKMCLGCRYAGWIWILPLDWWFSAFLGASRRTWKKTQNILTSKTTHSIKKLAQNFSVFKAPVEAYLLTPWNGPCSTQRGNLERF